MKADNRARRKSGEANLNLAKITRPALQGALERPRLFQLLDKGRQHPVVWISGPAGAGKTTLISSYVASRKLSCLWYQLDEGDADPATFFHYMGLAGRKAAPRRRKPLPHLTPEYLLGVPTFARRFFEGLGNRLTNPSVIVLDNFQAVPPDSPLHAALLAGFSSLPEGNSTLILSREAIPEIFTRLRANSEITEVDWESLRLTEAESRRLWKLHGGCPLSKQDSRRLYEQTAGWAAGIVLLSRRGEMADHTDLLTPRDEEIEDVFNYFAGEIFDAAEPETRDFLLRTALLPSMTVDMAVVISGNEGAHRLLRSLCRRHFFTECRQGKSAAYQYHPLFRAFLLARGHETFTTTEVGNLRRLAARLLMEAGHFDEAGALLIKAEDWPSLARLAVEQAPLLSTQGRCSVLESWLAQLPAALIKSLPWLGYWKGVCRLPFNQQESGRCFEVALEAFCRTGDAAGAFLAWSGAMDSILFGFEDFSRLDPWVTRLDDLLRELGPVPGGAIEARVASSMYAALVHRRPDHPDFDAWEARALACSEENTVSRAQVLLLYLCDKINLGKVAAIERIYTELGAFDRRSGLPPLARLTALVAKTMYFHFTARPDDCLDTVQEGMTLARKTGVHLMDFMLLGNGVLCALSQENMAKADELLTQMPPLTAKARPWDLSFHHFLLAWHALLQSNLAAAHRHVGRALELTCQVGTPFSIASTRMLEAHVLAAQGRPEEAADRMAGVLGDEHIGSKPFWRFIGLLGQAEFTLARDREAAIRHLREALAIGSREGYIHTYFFWRRRPMAELCRLALEEGIEVVYVRELVRRRGLVPADPPLHIEAWPWPVKIFTLGRFGILKEDASLHSSGKGRHKLLEMLKLLIALGGRDVCAERLSDFLWPDADGDAAQSNLKTTLSRLHKWLGDKEIFEFQDGRLSLDAGHCWVDVWAFERAMSEAQAHSVSDENAGHVEAALALYRGAFLVGEDADWTLSTRERLRRRYLQGLLELGLYREKAGQWEAAAECYRRGLQVEDLAEELYQRLMACYTRLGLRAEALVTYEQCRQALQGAFGVEPSPRTRTLCRDIRDGG